MDRRTVLPASWLRTTLPIRPCHSAEDTGPERLGSDHLAPQGVGRCSSTVAEGAGAAEGILRQQERGATLRGLQISADAGRVGTKKLAIDTTKACSKSQRDFPT